VQLETAHACSAPTIFGTRQFGRRRTLLLPEGELDTLLAWEEAGDLVDVASLGSATQGIHPRARRYLLQYGRILIARDDDTPPSSRKRPSINSHSTLSYDVNNAYKSGPDLPRFEAFRQRARQFFGNIGFSVGRGSGFAICRSRAGEFQARPRHAGLGAREIRACNRICAAATRNRGPVFRWH
jgi:hypothetical protein